MQTPVDLEIREQIARYLAGEQSLHELLEWLLPLSREGNRDADREAEALTNEILLRWAEYTNGDWSEEELKDLFRPLLPVGSVSAGHRSEPTR